MHDFHLIHAFYATESLEKLSKTKWITEKSNRFETTRSEMKWNAKYNTELKMVNEYYVLKKWTVSWLRYAWVTLIDGIHEQKMLQNSSSKRVHTSMYYFIGGLGHDQVNQGHCYVSSTLTLYSTAWGIWSNAFTVRAFITLRMNVHRTLCTYSW